MNGRTKKRTAAALLALIAAMSLSSCAPAEIVARWFKYDIDSVTGEDGWGEHIEKRLINAIEKQDHELLEKYLQEGTDPELIDLANFEPDEKDPHYPPSWRSYSPLFMASWTGDVESVLILLKYGVNTERKDYFGKTALDRLKETDRSNDSEAYRDYYGQIIEMLENAKKEAASNEE